MSSRVGHEVTEGSWRRQAARVVVELFAVTPSQVWDDLMELRGRLLGGGDWEGVLDSFLVCRQRLEQDHYVPFYRLRRLLEAHLRLETRGVTGLEVRTNRLALWRHRGMDDLRRRAALDHWEHQAEEPVPDGVRVEVVELGA